MRFFAAFALLASLLTPAWSQNSPFPPSPKQLVAANPVTNKVYVVNESSNSVTVLDLSTNATKTIPVGNRPQFIVVNPLTNRIFVNNGGEASLTVIDGATDTNLTPTPLAVGSQGPMAINAETNIVYIVRMTSVATDEVTFFNGATNNWYTIATESFQPTALTINPFTNTLYVAHYGTGDVRVISGAYDNTSLHPATFSIPAWSHPFAIAANSVTNRVYVITEDSRGPIGIINGADNTSAFPLPTAGHAVGPKALAVNPVTNKAYAAFSNEVIVIDGATNAYTYIPVATGTGAASVAINYLTDTIYVSNDSGTLTVINGATNTTSTVTIPAGTISLATNPATNEIYAAGGATDAVSGATGTPTSPQPATSITPLPSNRSGPSGSITLNASNASPNPLPIRAVYFQLDTLEGAWTRASGTGPYVASYAGLAAGSHTIHALAVEGRAAPTDTGQQSNPYLGGIASYTFTVGAVATPTASLASSKNPSSVGESITFTASVVGSGASPTGAVAFKDGPATITGCEAVALSSGSAACTTSLAAAGSHPITAIYAGDGNYSSASASVTQTANKSDAAIVLTPSSTSVTTGQSVALSATFSGDFGVPGGTAAFLDGGATIAGCSSVMIASGTASCTTSFSTTGTHSITASYSGDTAYNAGTSGASAVTVNAPALDRPTTISPTGTVTTLVPTFTWNAVGGASSYDLLLQTPAGADAFSASYSASAAGCASGSGQCSITPANAVQNAHSYNWFVRARNTGNASAFSAARAINVMLASKARLTDLDGDGRSDLLYRNIVNGQVFRMLMSGFSVANAALVYAESNLDWHIVADADFNGDGVSDLLWRNATTGRVYMQFFDASGRPSGGSFIWTEPNPSWRIVATPDFDGDGKADILWWNSSTGQVYAMRMDGAAIVAQGNFYSEPDTQWSIVAVGDFAGSGKRNQLVWRNASSGQVWLMTVTLSGATFGQTGQMIYREPNIAWKIVAAADFDGDGKSDILWRNDSTGQVYMQLMNGAAVAGQGMVLAEPNTSWKIVSVGDYDGDGRSDLLWRNDSTGQVYMILMNGLTTGSQAMVYNEPNTSWHLLGPREYAQ